MQIDVPFLFFFRFDILVDGYNSLDKNSIHYYLLFRARDTVCIGLDSDYGSLDLENPSTATAMKSDLPSKWLE